MTRVNGNFVTHRDGARVAAFSLDDDRLLFEAAPGLLAALRDLVAQIAAYDHLHGKNSCMIDDGPALSAIATATGEPITP